MNPTPEWLEQLVKLPDIDINLKTFGGHKQKVLSGWRAPQETHFAFEIMLIIAGRQRTIFEASQFDFVANDVILIPPGRAHENTCVSGEGLEYFCMHFDLDEPEVQQQLLMHCPLLLKKANPAYQVISQILQHLIAFLANDHFGIKEKIAIEILLLELMSALLDYVEDEKLQLSHTDSTSLVLAKSIAESIQQNFRMYTQDPSEENEELLSMSYTAHSLNISNSTMLTAFKKVYSCSPKKYLDQLRFNQAKFYLHQPKLAICEIAEIVGYRNAAHFTRQFRKWANMSPKDYRGAQLEAAK
ncbi:transcriptional regulator, AraC family [Coriobacterium glomerans PW2]|uniref:Transcriptional regulator, AraC family n=1 Tax=Coriobacterium glomerans (strain ATCC 49209 / DSM 20642 / JCM 10262 / PW2) TaxID=700015 RepID=F2NB44_CORGP|nr:AraC family transcriptional regulator [Coriobacterium glomerans]AEB07795.1 transcriptional regulator, AraC family [Coriobacterium glomerans PW2]